MHLFFHQRFGMRMRVADGGRAQDELRAHAVERADALEPADHVGDVAAEHAAVGMDLIDHHVAQVLEELRPLGVVRQDRLVQHVRVADHDVAVQADRLARVAGRIAVEGEGLHAQFAGAVEFQQFGDLVLRQRLGREQVQRLGIALHGRAHHRQRVAQRLARSGGCDDGHVLAALGGGPGLGLVRVQLFDAARLERCLQRRGHVVGDRRMVALAAGDGEAAGDPVAIAPCQPLAEQRTVARGQAVGGRQRPFAGFGAGSEGERHAGSADRKTGMEAQRRLSL